jgi:hypothetical protein
MGLGHARSLMVYGHDTTIYTLLLYRLFPQLLLLLGWACYVRSGGGGSCTFKRACWVTGLEIRRANTSLPSIGHSQRASLWQLRRTRRADRSINENFDSCSSLCLAVSDLLAHQRHVSITQASNSPFQWALMPSQSIADSYDTLLSTSSPSGRSPRTFIPPSNTFLTASNNPRLAPTSCFSNSS